MQAINRFSFPPEPDPPGNEVVRRAGTLKIELHRDDNGGFYGEYEVKGDFGSISGIDTGVPVDDGMRFMRGLIAEFERSHKEGGAA